ncbi:MAG: hypothetical protein K9J30_09155 [Bacteroidales bacterium]|nr:hypothetical protein [Bacteroidales bacterium]MCF8346455.1 hypothetical protein [Bacteroidales bacterium]
MNSLIKRFQRKILFLVFLLPIFFACNTNQDMDSKIPLIFITDLYHPYNDPGDNLDLINAYAFSEFDLKGVILDITDAFRKPVADHPTLWKDPRGPREAGIIPVLQLNYIFDKNIPWAIGPMSLMESETDPMLSLPEFQENGIELFLQILRETPEKIEIMSTGSARIIAVAFNREPELLREKISKVYLSAGTAAPDFKMGKDIGANMIPGGEWNVALDVFAFTRLLRSDLPIAIFPCAGIDGGFEKDVNNTYWGMQDMGFVRQMDERLQRYIAYAFTKELRHDFLRAMNADTPVIIDTQEFPSPFHFWEPPIWLIAARRQIVERADGSYRILTEDELLKSDRIIPNYTRPCKLTVRDDGRFLFEYTDEATNFTIYVRDDLDEHEKAFREALPVLLKTYVSELK